MATTDTYVRARIDRAVKDRAETALEAMGLDVSTAIRMMLTRVGAEGVLPFEVRTPNATTKRALAEADAGKMIRIRGGSKALLASLNADD